MYVTPDEQPTNKIQLSKGSLKDFELSHGKLEDFELAPVTAEAFMPENIGGITPEQPGVEEMEALKKNALQTKQSLLTARQKLEEDYSRQYKPPKMSYMQPGGQGTYNFESPDQSDAFYKLQDSREKLDLAVRYLDRALNTPEAKKGAGKAAFQNELHNIISAGISGMLEDLTTARAAKQLTRGQIDDVNESLINAYGQLENLNAIANKEVPRYRRASGIAGSLPYMEQFLLTGGVGTTAGGVAKTAAQTITKGIASKAVKGLARRAVQYPLEGAISMIGRVPLSPATYGNIAQESIGQLKEVDGQYYVDPKVTPSIGQAIAKGTYNSAKEIFSESLGGMINVPTSLFPQALNKAISPSVRQFFKMVGMNNPQGEYFEEMVSQALGGENPLDPEFLKDLAVTIPVITGGFSALSLPSVASQMKINYDKKKVVDIFGWDTVNEIYDLVQAGDSEAIGVRLYEMQNPQAGWKDYDNLVKYAASLVQEKAAEEMANQPDPVDVLMQDDSDPDAPIKASIDEYGAILKYNNNIPLGQDPNPLIRLAKHKTEIINPDPKAPDYFIVQAGEMEGDPMLAAYDYIKLKESGFKRGPDGKFEVRPVMLKENQLRDILDIPYQQWQTDEVNQFKQAQVQGQQMIVKAQAPVQEGQEITLGDKTFNVTFVDKNGITLNEIDKQGNITGGELIVPLEDYEKVFGVPAAGQDVSNVSDQVETSETGQPAAGVTAEPAPAPLPVNKKGEIEYDQITEPDMYAQGLTLEFGEDAPAILDELIAEQTEALAKAKKGTNAIERARKVKAINAELKKLSGVKEILTPTATATQGNLDAQSASPVVEQPEPIEQATVQDVARPEEDEYAGLTNQERNGVMFAKALPGILNEALERQRPFRDAFLARVRPGLTYEQYSKLPEEERAGLQELWVNSPEFAEMNAEPEEEQPAQETPEVQLIKANAEVDTNPTEAQKEAGNYQKGHLKLHGLDMSIENPVGSIRKGTDKKGNDWAIMLNNSYGYIRRTVSPEGNDQVDVFLGDNLDSDSVYVIDQIDPDSGKFDEHKVMIGFNSAQDAKDNYLANYEPGWKGLGAITAMPLDEFKQWVFNTEATQKPLAYKEVADEKQETIEAASEEVTPAQSQTEGDIVQPGPKGTEGGAGEETKYQYVNISDKAFVVKGDTKPIKDKLKELGGRWHPKQVAWMFPLTKLNEVKAALEGTAPTLDAKTKDDIDLINDIFEGKRTSVKPTEEKVEPSYGDSNKLFTKDAAEKAREVLRRKLGQLNSGLDPEMMQAGLTLAGYHIEAGARKFSDYAKKMIEDLGVSVKPYLKSFYTAVMYYPGFDNKGMDSITEVEKMDVDKVHDEIFQKPKDFIKDHIIVATVPKQEEKPFFKEIDVTPIQTRSIREPDGWRENLIKARMYANEVIPFERREILRSEGELDWTDRQSIINAIDNYLKQNKNEPRQEQPSIEVIESKAEAIVSQAENVTDREQAGRIIEEIDSQIDDLDSQLKLIGEYKIPEEYYKTHEYPHKGLEPILKKDLTKFSKELARILGWEHDTDKKGKADYGRINIPPAGGDGTFILWKPNSDLGVYVDVSFRPVSESDYSETWAIDSIMGRGREIMWRLTTKANKYSGMTNHFVEKDITAGELKVLINKAVKGYENSENKSKFDYPQLDYENSRRNKSVANAPGESSSELDGGLQAGKAGRAAPTEEVGEVSGTTGRESRGADQSIVTGRKDEGDGRGRSDRDITGPTEGGLPGVAGEPIESDTRDREKPEDLTALNHVIREDDTVVPKGEVAKIRANIAAIELLTKLEKQNRNATPEEKQVLAKYTGWGGLAAVLDESKYRWISHGYEKEWAGKYAKFHERIKELLTEDDFKTAVNSTINAHYTSIPIIRQLWSLAQHLGFQGGKVIEPAGGVGHFIGAMPEKLGKATSFTAYELDNISGRILSKLYPQASVHVTGYEESKIPATSQDLIITNVPFGKTAPFDKKNQDISKFSLHNYFIAKGIRQLKPGGVGIFITSSSTMDNAASIRFREWAVTEGNSDLIGAIRLPNNAFKENAGTEVTTDVLIFRKRNGELPSEYAQDFRITKTIAEGKSDTGEMLPIDVNEYFVNNPENILGKMMLANEAGSGGLYSANSQTAAPIKGMDLESTLAERIKAMPSGVMNTEASTIALKREKASEIDRDGTLVDKEGVIYEVVEGELVEAEWNNKIISLNGKKHKASKIAQDYLRIKDQVNMLLELEQSEESTNESIESARKKLNKLYDSFVTSYKAINRNKALEFLEDDSEFNMVQGLEDIEVIMKENKAGRLYPTYNIVKSPIFSKRVNFPVIEPTEAKNLEDAYNISLSYRSVLDPSYIATLLNSTTEKISDELIREGFAYKNPVTGAIEDKDTYLSGYVKTKYKEALAATEDNPEFARNVEELKKVLPKDIPGQLIKFRLGTSWIPPNIIQDFIKETTGLDVEVVWVKGVEKWAVRNSRYSYHAKNNTSGAGGLEGIKLIEHALHLSRPRITKKEYIGDGKYSERTDPEATAAAIGKMEEHMDNFVSFVQNNSSYVEQIEKVYNEEYNNFIEKKYSLPTFKHYPGANEDIQLYEHQRKAVTRSLKGSTLLAHQVGTGKTFTMITTAMEMRRLGIAKKPMIVVQNATIEQFAKSFRVLYPAAKILVAGKNDSQAGKRQKIFNRIAYGDWDAVILPQSFLNFIPDDPAREKAYIDERIAELEAIKDAAAEEGKWNNPIVKEAQNAIKVLEDQLQKKSKKVKDVAKANLAVEKKVKTQLARRRDDVRTFEKMGVDALFVDEAHAYKKLGFSTAMQNVRGIDTKGSQRAISLRLKVRFIQEKMNGRNVILATGTPISNTMAEVWTMMNYIAPDVLKSYHIETFDKFASTYGNIEPSLEFTASGKFKTVDRFKSYNNAPELILAFRANSDVVLTEDVQEFKDAGTIPKLKNNQFTQVILSQTPGLTSMMARFRKIMEEWEQLKGKEKREKRHIPLVVFGRAKQAAIDLRLLSPSFSDEPGSKTNAVVKQVKRIYDATSSYKGTQLIFSDMYQSPEVPGQERFNLYEEIKRKLVKQGIPANEIEIIADQTDTKRENIFEKINNGEIRVLMGSTEKLGTGVNVQVLLAGLHHVDAPPRPMDFEQRNGRILRQGNTHAGMNLPVEVVTYGVEKTLDATAYQRLAIKQKFINQMMKGEGIDREMTDAADEDSPTDMTFDHMMATLSGSQTAILHTFKVGELRKLTTAKQNFERSLIEAKSNLRNEKDMLVRSKERLALAEKAAVILNERFPDGTIKSFEITYKGKTVDILKGVKERKDAVEVLAGYIKKVKENTLSIEAVPDKWEGSDSQRAVDNELRITINGLNGYIRYNPRSLVDNYASEFDYSITVMPGLYRQIASGFSAASGFFISAEAQTKKMAENLVKFEQEDVAKHERNIPEYEKVLTRTFDKQDKLNKVMAEVKELEAKMKDESTESKSGEEELVPAGDVDIDNINFEDESSSDSGPEDVSLVYENEADYVKDQLDGYNSEDQRQTAVEEAISQTEERVLDSGLRSTGDILQKILPRTVLKGFKESGYVDFIGQKIESPQDIADLWAIHRSPYIEKAHLIFVRNGKIVATTASTINRIGSSMFMKPQDVLRLYNKYKADGVYYLHNHPSGNHQTSLQDIITTNAHYMALERGGANLLGALVIDHNKFSYIDIKNNPIEDGDFYSSEEVEDYKKNRVQELEYKNPVSKLFHERESIQEGGQERMFEIARALLTENNYKGALVYVSSNLEISAYDVFPEGASAKDIIRLAKEGLKSNLGRSVVFIHDGSYGNELSINGQLPYDTLDVINTAKNESQWFSKEPRKDYANVVADKLWDEESEYKKSEFAGEYLEGKQNITQTPAFKKWFGDSKVVDENGKPLVVYHGTINDFDSFDLSKTGISTDSGMWGKGFYFSISPEYAGSYANRSNRVGSIIPAYLSIKNPLIINNSRDIPAIVTSGNPEHSPDIYSNKFRDYLLKNGYDGIIAHGDEFVALSPAQIKSATGNKGTFDPENPSILEEQQAPYQFAGDWLAKKPDPGPNPDLLKSAAQVYKEKEAKRTIPETIQGIREYIQDMNLPIRKFEEEVLKRGGKQDNNSKPYRDTSLSFGRQEKLYTDFFEQKMKPILRSISKMKKAGIPGEEVLPYVISKHAIERNAVMRGKELREWVDANQDATPDEIDAKREELKDKDYSGVMAFDTKKQYKNPDELAWDIVREFESRVDKSLIDELWSNVKTATQATLETWEAGNQLSPDQKKEYQEQYRYFVPLRGWRDDAAKELVYTRGEGFSNSLKKAEGRKSLADNPLAYILSVQFQAIAEQVDNEVKISMYNLIARNLNNPEINELATIKKLYNVKVKLPDGTEAWMETDARPAPELFASGDAKTKIYREHERLRKPRNAREHEVIVRKPGGDMIIVFKKKHLTTAQALNKQNYMFRAIWGGIYDARDMNKVMSMMGYFNNMLKALYTSWNVVFPFTNFMRDFQEASITQSIKQGTGLKVMINYRGAFPAVFRNLIGKPNLNNQLDRDLQDFYTLGGATGYTHTKTIEEIEKEVDREVDRLVREGTLTGSMKNGFRTTMRAIETWNKVFEDATRFSVYLSSIAAGNSKQDAAIDAKEASVNFNRKGKGSKAWDSWFAFFNVAMQSLQKNFKLAKDHGGKFSAIAGSFIMMGFLEALMNAMTDDDEPDSSYYNINPYMRQNYLIIPNLPRLLTTGEKGNKYLSIPLPQFWRGFKSIGAIAFDIATRKMTVKDGIMDALGNFASGLLPVDVGGFWKSGEFSFAPIAPTIFKPGVEVLENRNYMGYTIKNEPFTRELKKSLANAGLGKNNVSPAAKYLTDMLFRWGGGKGKYKYYYDQEKGESHKVPGLLDINPSSIEHLFKGYTGGTGTGFSDLITTVVQATSPDQDIDFRNVPFLNRFIRKIPEDKWNIIGEYYDLRDDAKINSDLQKEAVKEAERTGDWSEVTAMYGNEYLQRYHETFRYYESELDDAMKMKDFDLVEGNRLSVEIMERAIQDIQRLKQEYGKK